LAAKRRSFRRFFLGTSRRFARATTLADLRFSIYMTLLLAHIYGGL
jgi:hypothetical protein